MSEQSRDLKIIRFGDEFKFRWLDLADSHLMLQLQDYMTTDIDMSKSNDSLVPFWDYKIYCEWQSNCFFLDGTERQEF